MVYNEGGELVVSTGTGSADDRPARMSSTVTNADETLVYIPAGSGYSIELQATDEGQVAYAVNEYNPLIGGVTRIVTFPEVSVSEGDELLAALPAWEEDLREESSSCEYSLALVAQSSIYSLSAPAAEQISTEADLAGEEAHRALYDIQAISSESSLGAVMGSGKARLGDWAAVTAYPLEGASFAGWFNEGELVSHDAKYRFRVDSDITLSAVFEKE